MFKGALDERKQKILKAVVHEHVETAEPVGSEVLVAHYDFGVRSATIRNEMAELSELGYLRQPHTSAGRVPSDQGYRFYVDRLMGPPLLQKRDEAAARRRLSRLASELEMVISETCRTLSELTCYTSVATQPVAHGAKVSHIGISRVGTSKLLLMVVISDGHVEHRILDLAEKMTDADVQRVSNMVGSQYTGRTVDEAASAKVDVLFPEPMAKVYRQVMDVVQQVAESLVSDHGDICVEGTNYVLRQPEFKDIATLEAVLAALEQRRQLYQLLTKAMLGADVMVIIGSENPYKDMHHTSFVASTYKIGNRPVGTIGVVGPTRMDYRRAISAVEAMARNLSELLTVLSPS